MHLWDKGGTTRESIISFTCGRDRVYDAKLAPYDIVGSMAHAVMLEKCGLITAGEKESLLAGLARLFDEAAKEDFCIGNEFEDIHSWVEIRLGQMEAEEGGNLPAGNESSQPQGQKESQFPAGNEGSQPPGDKKSQLPRANPVKSTAVTAAGKLHTGRSRNDQVLTDLHLYIRHRSYLLAHELKTLAETFLEMSEQHKEDLMPGFTHMQAAMVTSFGLWFASYAESLCDDLHVLSGAAALADASPLGSAAGYGTSLPIDRELTAKLLGFRRLIVTSPYAQMSRGRTERQITGAIAAAANTLGRFASDVILFMSPGYSFLTLADEITTGSSIMPHKKNPDVFELIRARSNRLQAVPGEVAIMTTGLPPGYNRDYQELKALLFDTFDEIIELVRTMQEVVKGLVFNQDILQDTKYNDIFSVEEANRRVRNGLPFREAYRLVAGEAGSGKFESTVISEYTHTGSIGNIGTGLIKTRIDNVAGGFSSGYSPEELVESIKNYL